MSEASSPDLGRLVRSGLAWSAASNLVLRFGTVAVGIALARLLSPEQFGIYAVALTVQAVLMSFADLGLSAGLIVSDDPDRDASTVGALGLAAGSISTAAMFAVAGPLADVLGSPESAQAIRWLSLTLLLAGAGVVPFALLQRRFAQKQIFLIAVVDFAVSTVVTLSLIQLGWGVIGIAVGRVAAQSVTLALQFRAAEVRPSFVFRRAVVARVMRFGLPIAGTALLSLLVLNLDKVVLARVSGPLELGFYVLAFNVASWPMSALGQVVRSVSLPAFARGRDVKADDVVVIPFSLAWACALPAGACLAVLASPLVVALYGGRWAPAAPVLAALGVFGALRVLFDIVAAFLLARGRSGAVLWVQIVWCAALIPALVLMSHVEGAVGVGLAHIVVALLIVVPAYAFALAREGQSLSRLALSMARPTLSVLPAVLAGGLVGSQVESAWVALSGGFLIGGLVYMGLMGRWIHERATTRSTIADEDVDVDAPHIAPTTSAVI